MYLINDVATDLTQPPPKGGKGGLSAEPYSKEHQSQVAKKFSDLRPIVLSVSIDQAIKKVVQLISKESSVEIQSQDKQKKMIHAVATTFLLRFKDDIVFRFVAISAKQTKIDIRSSSRVGRSDFDANYKRIKELEKALMAS